MPTNLKTALGFYCKMISLEDGVDGTAKGECEMRRALYLLRRTIQRSDWVIEPIIVKRDWYELCFSTGRNLFSRTGSRAHLAICLQYH